MKKPKTESKKIAYFFSFVQSPKIKLVKVEYNVVSVTVTEVSVAIGLGFIDTEVFFIRRESQGSRNESVVNKESAILKQLINTTE